MKHWGCCPRGRGEDRAQEAAGGASPFWAVPPSPVIHLQRVLELEVPTLKFHPLFLIVLLLAISAVIKIVWVEVKRCVSGMR